MYQIFFKREYNTDTYNVILKDCNNIYCNNKIAKSTKKNADTFSDRFYAIMLTLKTYTYNFRK